MPTTLLYYVDQGVNIDYHGVLLKPRKLSGIVPEAKLVLLNIYKEKNTLLYMSFSSNL